MVLCGFRRDVRRISDNLLSVLLLSKFRIYCHSYSDSPDSPFRSLQLQAVPPSHGILLESSLGSRKGNWELAEAVLAPSLAAVLCACLIHHPSPRCSQLCYLHLHKASSGEELRRSGASLAGCPISTPRARLGVGSGGVERTWLLMLTVRPLQSKPVFKNFIPGISDAKQSSPNSSALRQASLLRPAFTEP